MRDDDRRVAVLKTLCSICVVPGWLGLRPFRSMRWSVYSVCSHCFSKT